MPVTGMLVKTYSIKKESYPISCKHHQVKLLIKTIFMI